MHTYIHLVFFQMLRLVLGAIGSVLEATGLTGLPDWSDRSAQNRPNCFMCCSYQSLSKSNLFVCPYTSVVYPCGPRIRSKMSDHHEKKASISMIHLMFTWLMLMRVAQAI